jgi:hypothetical protein
MRAFPRSGSALRPRLVAAWLGAVLAVTVTACSRVEEMREISQPPRIDTTIPRPSPSVSTPSPETIPGRFVSRVSRVGPDHIARMGTSWKAGCPVPLEDLRVIAMRHWGFDGRVHDGELMVHRRYSRDVTNVFRTLFRARFPIERMELANGYMGNDPPLAQRNNTVGFNCRAPVGGGHTWSEHAYGRAVDINPDLNPYVSRSGRIEPLYGKTHVDRSLTTDGMIHPHGLVVGAFRAIGWRWGGSWTGTKDYMHFSATGR